MVEVVLEVVVPLEVVVLEVVQVLGAISANGPRSGPHTPKLP